MDYQKKYLKYKFKFFNLHKQIDEFRLLGGVGKNKTVEFDPVNKTRKFINADEFKKYLNDEWFLGEIAKNNVYVYTGKINKNLIDPLDPEFELYQVISRFNLKIKCLIDNCKYQVGKCNDENICTQKEEKKECSISGCPYHTFKYPLTIKIKNDPAFIEKNVRV
jgi:hypothetical protein